MLSEGFIPITQYLRDRAIIKDIETVKYDLKERVRVSVLRLATAKDTYYFTTENEKSITYFQGRSLEFTSKTIMKASAEAIVTAGFDMNNFSMEINHAQRELILHLPQPNILSNEVSLSFSDPDEDLLGPSMKSDNYTELNYSAKRQALEYAKDGQLFSQAKTNARNAVMNIFQSIMELPQFNYVVRVVFKDDFMYNNRVTGG